MITVENIFISNFWDLPVQPCNWIQIMNLSKKIFGLVMLCLPSPPLCFIFLLLNFIFVNASLLPGCWAKIEARATTYRTWSGICTFSLILRKNCWAIGIKAQVCNVDSQVDNSWLLTSICMVWCNNFWSLKEYLTHPPRQHHPPPPPQHTHTHFFYMQF